MGELLFFTDVETTGLPNWGKPADAEGQPRVASMAGVLVNREDRHIISFYNLPVRPVGWSMPEDIAKIHGMSHDWLDKHGIEIGNVLILYRYILGLGATVVAHNLSFDLWMMRGEMLRAGLFEGVPLLGICTLKQSPQECKIDRGNKRLGTMYKYYTGKEPTDAHRAIGDVKMLRELFFAMHDRGIVLTAEKIA